MAIAPSGANSPSERLYQGAVLGATRLTLRVDQLIDRARATLEGGGVEHAKTLRALARLVFTHAFAEEAVLFPAGRRVLPEGDPLTLHIERAHQEATSW